MRTMRVRTILMTGGAVAAIGMLTACSGMAAVVYAEDVEEQTENQLEEQVGQRPDITCPEDLPAEVGASIECELTDEGMAETYAVAVTVTDVADDGTVGFDIQVAEEPMA